MGIILKRNRGLINRVTGKYQLKIAVSYMVIIFIVLVLLNTYPVLVSQTSVFRYKETTMTAQTNLIVTVLTDLDPFSNENISRVMSVLDDRTYRVIVCNEAGLIVYDNSVSDNSVGRYAVFPDIERALSGREIFRSDYKAAAFESRSAIPVANKGKLMGVVYLYEYDADQAANLEMLKSNLFKFSMAITFAGLLISLFVSIALTRRVSKLLKGVRSVRDGNYGYNIDMRGRDELAEVAGQFNELSVILEKNENLRQKFVSDASHELKTPLASIRLLTDSILNTEDMDHLTLREFVSDIGQEIDRLSRMTEKLMLLTRMESQAEMKRDLFDAEKSLFRTVNMLKPVAEQSNIELLMDIEKNLILCGDEDDFYGILFNLVENAIKYNKPGGCINVYAFATEKEICIVVKDNGVGIPEEDLPRVFERFYRVDKARSRDAGGTGLGLAIVNHTVTNMGGRVKIESTLGEGTRFILHFPKGE